MGKIRVLPASRIIKVLFESNPMHRGVKKPSVREQMNVLSAELNSGKRLIKVCYHGRENAAYTTTDKKTGKNCILVIGGALVQEISSCPPKFEDASKVYPFTDSIYKTLWGLFYHEEGHCVYTDMTSNFLFEHFEAKYHNFVAGLFNILEDYVIEVAIDKDVYKRHPLKTRPRKYFTYLKEKMFLPKCKEYKDDGTIESFMNYILLSLRCGAKYITEKNTVFEKYKEDLMPLILDVLTEPNGTKRIEKTAVLADWIIKNITEFKWEELPPPEDPIHKEHGPTIRGVEPGPVTPGGDPGAPSGPKDAPESEDGTEEKSPWDEGEGEDKPEEESPEEKPEIPEELDDSFNDFFEDGSDHEWVICRDAFEATDPSTIVESVNECIEKDYEGIQDISKFLEIFKQRLKPRPTHRKKSGSLNVHDFLQIEMRGEKWKTDFFDRMSKKGDDKDLAVSLLCDNSGSMSGSKSEICTRAAIDLAAACEYAHIPFECNAFTKTSDSVNGTCVTLIQKSFDEDFESSKLYFGITSSNLYRKFSNPQGVPVFHGNSEEINIYHIWQKLKRNPHKTRVLFVLCDGQTTGSESDLKKIVRLMEEDGITVIGIGVCCDEVAEIYPNHKLFTSQKQLEEELAPFLVDELGRLAV